MQPGNQDALEVSSNKVKMIKEIGHGKQNLVYFTAHNFFSLTYDDQENVSEKPVV